MYFAGSRNLQFSPCSLQLRSPVKDIYSSLYSNITCPFVLSFFLYSQNFLLYKYQLYLNLHFQMKYIIYDSMEILKTEHWN
jgi:hypothetical protein